MEDGYIIQCVPEARRAWHAGEAAWEGESDINSCSIGIEIANPGHSHGYPDFTKRQMAAVTTLCRSIFTRHRVPAWRVLGHSDVAPTRKQDPGEKFPWRVLHDAGIGLWVKPAPLVQGGKALVFGDDDPTIAEMQRLLGKYGYDVPTSGNFDGPTRHVIAAFQRHFRPARVDGVPTPRPSRPSRRCSRRARRRAAEGGRRAVRLSCIFRPGNDPLQNRACPARMKDQHSILSSTVARHFCDGEHSGSSEMLFCS
jgi:hypothetical protein